jgi:entericidin B
LSKINYGIRAQCILCDNAQKNGREPPILESCGAQVLFLYFLCLKIEFIFHIGRIIMIKRFFALLMATVFIAGTAASLTGCNTVEGAGKDMQQGGQAISNKANENK